MSINHFLISFMAFFAIMNPIANLPVFLSLTEEDERPIRQQVARRALLLALLLVLIFSLAGQMIFQLFGINLASLRVVGGILVFLIGYHMLQGKISSFQHTINPQQAKEEALNIAVSPLAMPILAGPGTLATAMNLSASYHPFMPILAFGILALISYFLFISGEKVVNRLGHNVMNVLTRMMGLILAVIGIEMLVTGLKVIFPLLASKA